MWQSKGYKAKGVAEKTWQYLWFHLSRGVAGGQKYLDEK